MSNNQQPLVRDSPRIRIESGIYDHKVYVLSESKLYTADVHCHPSEIDKRLATLKHRPNDCWRQWKLVFLRNATPHDEQVFRGGLPPPRGE